MRIAGVYLISIFIFFQGSLLAYSSNPKDFVNELVTEAIDKLADKNLDKDQKAIFMFFLQKVYRLSRNQKFQDACKKSE